MGVDSKKLEYVPRGSWAGSPSSPAFGVGGQSHSNFLTSTVGENVEFHR